MKVKKIYEAPEMEVLKMQPECMCEESIATVAVSNDPIDNLYEDGLERAIKGNDFFDANSMIGFPQF